MRLLYMFLTLAITISVYGQNVKVLEEELGFPDGENLSIAEEILEMEPNNFEAHKYITLSYIRMGHKVKACSYIDSIFINSSYNTAMLLNLADNLYYTTSDSLLNIYKCKLLRLCLKDKKTRVDASYFLGQEFYRDFIKPTKQDPPTLIQFVSDSLTLLEEEYEDDRRFADEIGISVDSLRVLFEKQRLKALEPIYPNGLDSAIKYLEILVATDSKYKRIAEIPLVQLKSIDNINIDYTFDTTLYNGYYFPEWYFGHIPKDWKNDLTTDLFYEMFNTSLTTISSVSHRLKDLEEPVLYGENKDIVYRITWEPSFDHPIVIRIVLNKEGCKLYWKVGKGKAGYGYKGIFKEGEERINKDEFYAIANSLDTMGLESEENYYYLLLTDGVSVTIERNNYGTFKALHSNILPWVINDLMLRISQKYFKEIDIGIEKY